MKMLYIFLLTILLIQTASAEVTFFNKSPQRSIEIIYKFYYSSNSIGEPVKITIPSKNSPEQKNYLTIQIPTIPENIEPISIEVLSAVEKDENGNIIAKGKYIGQYGECSHTLRADYESSTLLNIGIELDDQNLSPFILCKPSSY